MKQYKKLMKQYKFDFVHVHTPIAGAIVRMTTIPERFHGTKVYYTTHGLAFTKNSSLKTKLMYGGIEWLCSWFTDAIITINKEDFARMNQMHCKKVYYINGVGADTKKFHDLKINRNEYREKLGIKPTDIVILEVGELSTRKNHRIIVEALAKLHSQDYVFLVCGKAMSKSGTYDLIKLLSEEKGVRTIFLGFRTDIPEINYCADIAVLPSLREGLGMAGIEALASGVPVVGSNVQGIKDYVIDGKTGFLCDPMDADEFAEAIYNLSNKELRNSMKDACVLKAEEFRQEISFRQMEEIYKEIL